MRAAQASAVEVCDEPNDDVGINETTVHIFFSSFLGGTLMFRVILKNID
jgi:hypothetical protein